MRKYLIILFLFISFNIFCAKTRIAIVNFSPKGEIQNEKYLAEALVENLITALIDSGKFAVMERSQLKEIMKELKMQNSDDFNDDLREEIGNLYGAELVILGSLTKIGSRYSINVRGVNVKSGEAQFAKNLNTNSKDELIDLVPQIVDLITGKKTMADVQRELKVIKSEEEAKRRREERIDRMKSSPKTINGSLTFHAYFWGGLSLASLVPALVGWVGYLNPDMFNIENQPRTINAFQNVGIVFTVSSGVFLIPSLICLFVLTGRQAAARAEGRGIRVNKNIFTLYQNINMQMDLDIRTTIDSFLIGLKFVL